MKIWDQDNYLKAWNYASKIHQDQTMAGVGIPYINHLGSVTMEAMAAIANNEKINDPDLLISCALLHDSIEDTDTTYEDIVNEFDKQIADGVLSLTKNSELPSKEEQMKDSISRIKKQPSEVWMVKLCDRITNLQSPPVHWTKPKKLKYRDEAIYILQQLGEVNSFLSERLRVKINTYQQYL